MGNETADPEQKKGNVFFPHLDALRFFSFLAVFLYHSFSTPIPALQQSAVYQFVKNFLFGNGNLGVNFFFVLSGFLITYLLLTEKEGSGKINIRFFYIRRVLRIWPLYFFSVFFGFVLFPVLKQLFGQVPNETAAPVLFLTFLSNFDMILHGIPDSSVLGVLWSVAIEEQFYLLWPLILAFLPKRWYGYAFGTIIVASLAFRFFFINDRLVLDVHTVSCISDMAVGGFGAFLMFSRGRAYRWVAGLHPGFLLLLYSVLTAVVLFRKQMVSVHYLIPFERLIISAVFLAVILEQCFSTRSLFKLGRLKLISWLGRYTYGLYCLHMIAILAVQQLLRMYSLNTTLPSLFLLEGGVSLCAAVLLALVSYHFLERPFLALKDKFTIIRQ